MKDRLNKIKAKIKQHGPLILISFGAALTLSATHKAKQKTKKVDEQIEAGLNNPDVLVLEGITNDVYKDMDTGDWYKVKEIAIP